MNSNPSPLVQMSVGHKAQESKIRYKTNEPVWEENFTFFIHNPKRQELEVEVRDEQHQCSLGNLRIPLSQLLASEDMTMNQRFQLSNSGPNSSLKMKLALRVLPSAECGRGCTGPLVPHAGPGGWGAAAAVFWAHSCS